MENFQEQIQQARALERAQKNEAALDIFLSLSQKPGPHAADPAFWLHLGDVGRRADRVAVATDAYPRAIDLLEQADHRNSALAVARRLARAAPDSADVHLRLADLAASLGYARDARDASLRAAELAADGQTDAAVESLRAAWSLLQRDGLKQDAENIRARIMALRPDADPLGDQGLVAPARPASGSDDLAVLEGAADLAGSPPEPGLQPTAIPDTDVDPGLDRVEGLELTGEGYDWGTAIGEQEPAGRGADSDLPGHPDIPLLREEPDVPAPAADEALPLLGMGADRGPDPEAAVEPQHGEPTAEEPETSEPFAAEPAAPEPAAPEPAAPEPQAPEPAAPEPAAPEPQAPEPQAPEPPAPEPPAPEPPAEPAKPVQAPERPEPLQAANPAEPAQRQRAKEPEPAPSSTSRAEPEAADDYVDLGALVMSDEDDEEGGTRFQMDAAQHPSGDEDKDFAEILGMFRQKVSESIHPQDSSSHYDLGLAFKEMALYDDAIGQLQLALRGGSNPVATLEVLGECFIEKGEHSLAARVLSRAVRIPEASESDLLGVLYWLGRTQEVLESQEQACGYYERVIAVDIGFRDAAARLEVLRGGSAPSR